MPAVSDADSMASSSCIAGRSGRRGFLASLAGAAALGTMPAPSFASYALYQSSYDTITERKATGDWQKSIGSDTQTLADIQADIAKKRPSSKPKKAPQYCAGQMASVSPMYESLTRARFRRPLALTASLAPCLRASTARAALVVLTASWWLTASCRRPPLSTVLTASWRLPPRCRLLTHCHAPSGTPHSRPAARLALLHLACFAAGMRTCAPTSESPRRTSPTRWPTPLAI